MQGSRGQVAILSEGFSWGAIKAMKSAALLEGVMRDLAGRSKVKQLTKSCQSLAPATEKPVLLATPSPPPPSSAAATSQHLVVDKDQHVTSSLYERVMKLNVVNPKITSRQLVSPMHGFVLNNVLSGGECGTLLKGLTEEGLIWDFWNPDNPDKKDLRNALTVEVIDQKLADLVWERVKPHVAKKIVVEGEEDEFEMGLKGTWKACGINPVMLFGKYGPGCHFSPHTDGNNVIDFNNRSLYTALIYLNTCKKGGRTNLMSDYQEFVKDKEGRLRYPGGCIVDSAPVVTGSMLAFRQEHLHEGEPVGEDCEKIIIRTDVMYTRTPPVCTDEKGLLAYKTYCEAQQLESNKNFAEADRAYRRARTLSPLLGELLKIA